MNKIMQVAIGMAFTNETVIKEVIAVDQRGMAWLLKRDKWELLPLLPDAAAADACKRDPLCIRLNGHGGLCEGEI